MEALLARITALSLGVKVGILALLLALIGGGYYYFFYGDILVEKEQNAEVIRKAIAEEAEYKKRVDQYLAFRNEVNQLRDEQKELLRILPQNDDIEQFIENVNAQVELAGLSKVSSVREEARREEIYLRIPIRMSLVGNFHQIDKFFKSVGELQRIVTVAELALSASDSRGPTGNGTLKADFVAQTFQLLEAPRPASVPPGTTPGAPAAPAPAPGAPAAPPAGGGR
jgi:type IV pilus assembly protein PilO